MPQATWFSKQDAFERAKKELKFRSETSKSADLQERFAEYYENRDPADYEAVVLLYAGFMFLGVSVGNVIPLYQRSREGTNDTDIDGGDCKATETAAISSSRALRRLLCRMNDCWTNMRMDGYLRKKHWSAKSPRKPDTLRFIRYSSVQPPKGSG